MAFSDNINKYLPIIQTGLNVAGSYLGGRAQNQAIDRASGINQQATNDAMRTILGLYDEGQGQLDPYRSVGIPALNNLQRMANPGRTVAPIQAPVPIPRGNAMARFAPGSGALNPFAPGGNAIQNAMLNPKGQTAGQEASARNARNTGIGSTIGGVAGTVLGGPVGGVVGGLLGGLEARVLSKFGANNPYKSAASRGIDEVSRRIWGTNTPGIPPEQLTSGYVADAIQRRIPVAEAKQNIKADLDAWVEGMRANGTPDNVIQSSIRTQQQYLSPLRDVFARLESQPA